MSMKKVLLFTLALSALAISCNKTDALDNYAYGNAVDIKASIVEKVETKSNYDLAGSTGTFYWTGTEKIGWMRWLSSSSYFWQTELTSKTSADSKEKTLVFSGTSYGDEVEYAFYPIWVSTPQSGIGWTSSPFKLFIPESTAYNSSAPLKDIVPMIAKLNGEGDFVFTPVTALIGVHVKNLPSDARSITLSSTGVALSGYYYLTDSPATKYADNLDYVMSNGLTVSMATNASNTTGEKTITFSSGLGKEEYAFYFPVSVGTLPNLTISVKGSDDSVLQTVTYDKSITTSRAVISDLPLMDLAKATTLEITGTADAPYAYVGKFGPEAVKVKYAVASTAEAAKTAAESGAAITASGEGNKVSITPGTDVSGQYYVGYVVYNSSDVVLRSSATPFYYIASGDRKIAGTYQFNSANLYALTIYNRSAWVDLTQNYIYEDVSRNDNKFVLSISDDPSQGMVMITDILGFNYSGSMTNKGLIEDKLINSSSNLNGTYGAGAPLIGILNPSDGMITFNTLGKTFFTINGVNVYVRQYWGDQATLRFQYSDDGATATLGYKEYALCFVKEGQVLSAAGSKYGGSSCEVYMNGDNTGFGYFTLTRSL